MSRTWHHGKRNRAKIFHDYHRKGWPQEPAPPKKRRTAREGIWMRTPGWWVREMMTAPWRAKTKVALRRVEKMDPEDVGASCFPHPKRPHIYFW